MSEGETLAQLRTTELIAAAGDRETLLTLSRRALDNMARDPRQAAMWLTQSVTYARLAAVKDGGIVELRHIASVLFYHAQMLLDQATISQEFEDQDDAEYYSAQSDDAQAEALFWLNAAVDLGDDAAAELVRATVGLTDPRIPEHLSVAVH